MMQDRYLFRGKCVDNGNWVCGYYAPSPLTKTPGIQPLEQDDIYSFPAIERSWVEVDASTIGQCTGLRDKSETLIFEGDVCKVGEYTCIVIWGLSGWYFNYLKHIFIDDDYGSPKQYIQGKYEIIGNIHDTPELLKEVEDA